MKLVGKVLHVTVNKNIVAVALVPLEGGTIVYTRGKKPVGKVLETFGPVTSPYLLIKPLEEPPTAQPGEELYAEVKEA